MISKKIIRFALLSGAILFCASGTFAQQQLTDANQLLLDLLVKKGVLTQDEATALENQAQATAAANAAAANAATANANAAAEKANLAAANAQAAASAAPAPLPAGAVVAGGSNQEPLFFKIGSANFTPIGFLDFTTVYRNALNGGDIGSSFGSIPYSNTENAQLSETRFSAKNSRLGLRMDSNVGDTKVLGYVETDFLGNAATNINVASNSDVMRMRVYFVDLRKGDWEFLAGQDWSMLTPNRKGISPMPSDIFYTQDVDTNYQVGLVWGRTPQVRIVYHPSSKWALGVSAENPDQYVGSAVVLPANLTATDVDNGSNGTATPNEAPDFIGKIAFDTKIGDLPFHADLAGLLSTFKVNTFTTGVATPVNADATATGGGGSYNMILSAAPNFQLIENAFISKGGGRYISTGLGPDFIVTPPDVNGVDQIKTVYSYADMLGFEWDVQPTTKLFGYYGQAHYGAAYEKAGTTFYGYGYPGSPNTNNKLIEEYTAGFAQTLWKNPTKGDLKFIAQFSYLDRDPWVIATGTPSSAHLGMVYADLRYDIP
jgi:hypothetical protein